VRQPQQRCRRLRRQRKQDTARSTREEAPRLVPTPIGSRAPAAFDLAPVVPVHRQKQN
jgi:hypothetical protein